MSKPTMTWTDALDESCGQLVRWAIREDLDRQQDWTTVALVPEGRRGSALLAAREPTVVAGMPAVPTILRHFAADVRAELFVEDGAHLPAGEPLARLAGEARDLLTAERTVLNVISRLCGIATLTAQYVERTAGTAARIYDTRKTTAGWRRLEKYAVVCGGGCNHRFGLFDAILIKDNHLALAAVQRGRRAPSSAIRQVRAFLPSVLTAERVARMRIEIEVDTLDQLRDALTESPDIVLLDNMTTDQLRQAVSIRDQLAPQTLLEASGGVGLETVAEIARTGIERISVGSLTHAARSTDIGLDWQTEAT